MIKLVYFGTLEYSATVLEALATNSAFKVIAVITQPDRPTGRDQALTPPPVKIVAQKYHLPVLQPETLKNFNADVAGVENFEPLQNADLFVVYGYGLIIPQAILDLPKHGSLNIHPSLLPKYRGPTPIQSALLNGETTTGVSIMLLDALMDHGPIVRQINTNIEPDDTNQTLTKRLVEMAIPVLTETIPAWIQGEIKPIEQDHSQVTMCKMLSRDDGKIDWNKSADQIYNQYRAFTPWPGIWTTWEGKRLKLTRITPSPLRGGTEGGVLVENNTIFIACSHGTLEVLELQLEGKKPMTAQEFANGYKNFNGAKLG